MTRARAKVATLPVASLPNAGSRPRHVVIALGALAAMAATIALTTAAFANESTGGPRKLGGAEIRQKVTGNRIYLAAPLGGEFPLFYRADGRVDGSGEALGIGRWIRPTDTGRWWVNGDRLCQRWQVWYDGKTMCFTLTDLGSGKLRWVQDNGDTGVARLGR